MQSISASAAEMLRTSRRLEHTACAAAALMQQDPSRADCLGLLFTDAAHILLDSNSPDSPSASASAATVRESSPPA
eukprot:CAMPEP_0172152670 /NCGR_PEP_ID=MMETSP1050-20130122/983_1 /TAXON_ID=233186 /ORGANISM="Cryptomonas curvata, Strain CCAP979/52" /LENGTH=75 /DNA_ID=CAMNT_0012821051 /DNA_START=396 /DNA_END=623 /DNA_ORIENTATION=-